MAKKSNKRPLKKQPKGLNRKLKVIPFTKKVSYEEKVVVIPMLIKHLRNAKRKKQAMTNDHLRNILLKHNFIKVHYRSMQKLIHHIRINGLVKNLIAGTYGYYISTSGPEIKMYINQLQGRIRELQAVKKAIINQSSKILTPKKRK